MRYEAGNNDKRESETDVLRARERKERKKGIEANKRAKNNEPRPEPFSKVGKCLCNRLTTVNCGISIYCR